MMNTLRRWSSYVVASLDRMVSQIENHEALVNSAIREVQEAGARAKVQINRVRADGMQMRRRLAEMRDEAEQWKLRAAKVAAVDEKRALECLRRQKRTQQSIQDLEMQEREHAKHERQLTQDLSLIEERLVQLKQQRNLLRGRQSRAEALGSLRGGESALLSEIDEIFERWELKVSEYEMHGNGMHQVPDELEQDFLGKEEEEELRAALKELLVNSEAITN